MEASAQSRVSDTISGTTPPASAGGVRRRGRLRGLVIQQIGFALATLLLISIVTFWATSRSPEVVAINAIGREATAEQRQSYIEEHGLDQPIHVRYVEWLGDFVQGDWGTASGSNEPVRDSVLPRLWRTLILTLGTLLLAIPISLAVAVFMSRRAGGWVDLGLLTGTTIVAALPEFLIAIILLDIFGVSLGWLPIDGTAISFGTATEKVKAYILPIASLVLVSLPYTIRIGRAALCETMGSQYTRAAVLRGLPSRMVVRDFALRNAAVPIINTFALNVVFLISGVVVIENVFGFPGLGQLLVDSVIRTDTDTVQAIAMLMGAMIIAVTLVTDLLALYFNPRLRAP